MLKGIDIKQRIYFVPKSEQNVTDPTTFILRPLTNRDRLSVFNERENSFDIHLLLKKSICSIENFDDNKEIKQISDELLDKLPFTVYVELLSKVIELNSLTLDEQKNLQSPSGQS